MATMMTKTLYLPGAGASATFWQPVADRVGGDRILMAWPGLGNEPADPDVSTIDDLVRMVLNHMSEPVDIVAQSMGGLVAIKAALAAPTKIRRLVLAVTSAGIAVDDLGGSDWRADYYRIYPQAARWIGNTHADLSPQLTTLVAPTLLLWGDTDPISPLAVGERLQALMPNASLQVIAGGEHDLARTMQIWLPARIERHLSGV